MAQFLFTIAFILQTVSPQSVCIWGRKGMNRAVNGLYIASGKNGGKTMYSKSTPYNCKTMYIYWSTDFRRWHIRYDNLALAYCTSSSLSDSNSWYFPDDAISDMVIDSSVSSSFGSCPTHIWQCDTVHIPSLPSPCNQVFSNHLSDNLWTDSSATAYWYFDEDWFYWVCDEEHPSNCATALYAISPDWNYIANGQSSTLLFYYPNGTGSYTVNCIMNPSTTLILTVNPLSAPTASPTPKPIPTDEQSSSFPTVSPWFDSSTVPSDDISVAPSYYPSVDPFDDASTRTTTLLYIPSISTADTTANPTKDATKHTMHPVPNLSTQTETDEPGDKNSDDVFENEFNEENGWILGIIGSILLSAVIISCAIYLNGKQKAVEDQEHVVKEVNIREENGEQQFRKEGEKENTINLQDVLKGSVQITRGNMNGTRHEAHHEPIEEEGAEVLPITEEGANDAQQARKQVTASDTKGITASFDDV